MNSWELQRATSSMPNTPNFAPPNTSQFSQAIHYHAALYGGLNHASPVPLTTTTPTTTTTPSPHHHHTNNILNSSNVSSQHQPPSSISTVAYHHQQHPHSHHNSPDHHLQPPPLSPTNTILNPNSSSSANSSHLNNPHHNIIPNPVPAHSSSSSPLHHLHHLPNQQHPHHQQLPPNPHQQQISPGVQHNHHHHHSHHPPPPFLLKSPSATSSGPTTPVPQTPQGAPGSVNPFSPAGGTEHDLPPELLALGWRKFWSKRENRWYFWNCSTGESLWEVPPLPGHPTTPASAHQVYDPLTDPLGIQCGNGPASVAAAHLGVKRRVSSGESHPGNLTVKKFILAGPWDLEISSNVYVPDVSHPQKHLLPPHPEIEQLRAQLVAKLRQCYQTACQSREAIDAPKESLNRWFIEQKVTELKGIDPIFSSCENPEGQISNMMLKEIMNDIPMKISKARFTGDARKQLSKFAEACKRTVETRNSTAEARKVVKWKVEETFTWLRATQGISYDMLLERLQHLRVTCQPHVHLAAKASVEGICKKMSVLSKQYAQNVRDAHWKLFTEPENVKFESEGEKGKFRCYPAHCGPYQFAENNRLPTVDFVQPEREFAILKFRNDAVRISTQYLQKLEQLYRYNCLDDRKFEFFLVRSYCLLKRYNAYCDDFASCHSTQASLPVPVFEAIQRNFGVTFECFSTPFNCYFRQYCSAFPDIDGYFGSRGTFLDFFPVSGSFQVNPPFQEDLIAAAISHMEELLAGTREPMSFMVFLPEFVEERDDWGVVDAKNEWFKRAENSRWKRKQVTIPAYEHEGRHPAQHCVSKSEHIIRINHSTVIFWLQNEAGFEEWKPTEQRVDAIIDSYRPGRERERDRQELLSPERQMPTASDKMLQATAATATVVST